MASRLHKQQVKIEHLFTYIDEICFEEHIVEKGERIVQCICGFFHFASYLESGCLECGSHITSGTLIEKSLYRFSSSCEVDYVNQLNKSLIYKDSPPIQHIFVYKNGFMN